jgi:cell division septum initiation protein DivIVA
MSSIIDEFFGAVTRPAESPETMELRDSRKNLHPAAQEAARVYSDALQMNASLQRKVSQLQCDLEVMTRVNQGLEQQLREMTESRDMFQRYAVEMQTHLQHVVHAATTAMDRSLAVSETKAEPSLEADIDRIVDGLSDADPRTD